MTGLASLRPSLGRLTLDAVQAQTPETPRLAIRAWS